MCLIIVLPPKNTVDSDIKKKDLEHYFDSNSDGIGFMYVSNNKVRIRKYLNFDKFVSQFYSIRHNNNSSYFVLHFRKATSGKKDIDNCHPFYIRRYKTALAHNGVISKINNSQEQSDTLRLSLLLKKLPTDWYKNAGLKGFVENCVSSSRICILDRLNNITFINRSSWFEDKDTGFMYSNNSYSYNTVDNTIPFTPQLYYRNSGATGTDDKSLVETYQRGYNSVINNKKTDTEQELSPGCLCSYCAKPLVYTGEFYVGTCKDCMTAYDKSVLIVHMNTASCIKCKCGILGDQVKEHALKLCHKCIKKSPNLYKKLLKKYQNKH